MKLACSADPEKVSGIAKQAREILLDYRAACGFDRKLISQVITPLVLLLPISSHTQKIKIKIRMTGTWHKN